MKPYYYVPVHPLAAFSRIESPKEAKEKAEELAAENPGTAFEILQCIGISQTPVPTPSTFWLDEAEKSEVETRDNVIRNLKRTVEDQERVIMNLERALENRPLA